MLYLFISTQLFKLFIMLIDLVIGLTPAVCVNDTLIVITNQYVHSSYAYDYLHR